MIAAPVAPLAKLVSHPDTPCEAVGSIQSFLSCERSGLLTIVYTLNGAIDQLRIPPHQSRRRADRLWRHTCFEAFIGAKNDAEYYELNFSPSGEWTAYEFCDYRDGGLIDDDGLEPTMSVRQEPGMLELCAEIRLDRLPRLQLDVCLCVGLSAVIEDKEGRLSYWALKHVPGKPDFHHPENFILEIQTRVADTDSVAYTAKP